MRMTSFRATQRAGVLFGLSAMLASGAAGAAPGQGGAMAACRGDLQTYCAGIEAGGGKKVRCLSENQSKLSAECGAVVKQRLETRAQRMGGVDVAQAAGTPAPQPAAPPAAGAAPAKGVIAPTAAGKGGGKGRMAACRTDAATFCATAETGKGGRMKCLNDNKAKLSPECVAVIDEAKAGRQAKKTTCAAEAETLCGTSKGAARRQCLETNKPKLSADCATALDKRAAKRAEKDDPGGGKQRTGGMMRPPAPGTPKGGAETPPVPTPPAVVPPTPTPPAAPKQ